MKGTEPRGLSVVDRDALAKRSAASGTAHFTRQITVCGYPPNTDHLQCLHGWAGRS